MTDTEIKAILEELATVQNYLTAAQGVLDSGYMPDITALEGRVASLCERIQKSSPEIHDQCLKQLVLVLDQLNACEQKMKAFHASRTNEKKLS
jgi:hypothetical protein